MKYPKMLGMLAVAAAVMMVFAGTASATTLTAPSGTVYTSTIKAETEGHAILHNSFTTVECNSTVEGKVETHGSGVSAGGKISKLTFTGCTGSNTVHEVVIFGSLVIISIGGGNGRVIATGTVVVITNHTFGGSCSYSTNNTEIGTLTAAPSSTGHATLDISATIPRTGGTLGVFCGSTGTWTGSYTVTTPTGLSVDS